jgi:hypothetical protein
MLIPLYIYWVIIFSAFGYYAKGIPFGAITIPALLTSIMAGTAEEVAFREVGISYLARQLKDENKIILMVSGLYMLRRSKRAEIIALWNRRWSRDTGVTEEA